MNQMQASAGQQTGEENVRLIERMLYQLGFRPDLKGFAFVRDAIIILLEDRQMIFGITKTLYPEIAKLNNTTPSVVERGIRSATAQAWEVQGRDCLRAQFPDKFERPTNRTVLAFLVHFYVDVTQRESRRGLRLL